MIETSKVKALNQAEWAAFMVNEVAYIKPVSEDGKIAYAVFAADGTPLALIGDRDAAVAAVREHELEPMLAH
jgi:hypothetical protein